MDDFDQLYEDELEALDDVLNDFPGNYVKGKKSLDFSTPSTKRSKPFGGQANQQNESLLIEPLEQSVEEGEASWSQGKRKRTPDDIYRDLSEDEQDPDKENKDLDDIPDLRAPTRKRARFLEEQPVPDEFDVTPPPSPEPPKSSKPPQPEAQPDGEKNRPSQDDAKTVVNSRTDRHPKTRKDVTSQGHGVRESLSAEEKRLTQNYDFGRKRVHRRIPYERDYISVTNQIGRKFYMELRDEEVVDAEEAARESGKTCLSLLGVPLAALRAQIEEDKREREEQRTEPHLGTEKISELYPDSLADLPDLCELSELHKTKKDLPGSQALWVDKYSPQRYTELLSDESTNRLLLKWLKLWDCVVFGKEQKPRSNQSDKGRNKEQKPQGKFHKFKPEVLEELDNHQRPVQKVALLCGPPGLGKTTLGHVIARHAGYNVVEMNASDDRSTEVFKQKIESAIQMRSVLEADPRPNCLIIDEIDGAPTAAINILLNIIKSSDGTDGKKKRKGGGLLLRPIICICNDLYTPALRPLRQLALVVNFPTTEPTKLAGRLLEITKIENNKADLTTLLALCEKAENDIRSCINTLQFIKGRGKELTPQIVHSMNLGQKDVSKSLLSVWKHVFSMPRPKRKRYVNPYDRATSSGGVADLEQTMQENNMTLASRFQSTVRIVESAGEGDKILMGLFENYLLPKVKDPHLDSLLLGGEWIGFHDLVNRQVAHSQNYTLLRYSTFLSVAFHLLFATTAPLKVQYPQTAEITSKLQRCQNLVATMVSDVTPCVRKNLNVHVTVMDFVPSLLDIIQPALRPVNTQLYSARERKELTSLIDILIAYNISYRQERTDEGQYIYVLDPNLEELTQFPELQKRRQLSYAIKQLIAREVELEKMRRSEWKEEDLPKQKEEKVEMDEKNKSEDKAKELPNHMRQTLRPKAVREVTVERDFFGRKIEKKITVKKQEKKEEKIGGEIWFCFKEGFSNAVRRTMRVKEFM